MNGEGSASAGGGMMFGDQGDGGREVKAFGEAEQDPRGE